MSPGVCKHCLQFKDLCDSHAIPNAVFRPLLRTTPGGALSLVDDEKTPNGYSVDSWHWPILCQSCEADFEKRFDGFGMKFLKAKVGKFESVSGGVRISEVDQGRLAGFFASVAWRAAVSGHEAYSKLRVLSKGHVQVLQDGISGQGPMPHVAMSRLVDGTGELSRSVMREVAITPTVHAGGGAVTIFFLFSGFVIGVFVTRPKLKIRRSLHFLKPAAGAASFFVQDYSFQEFKPLFNMMLMSKYKEEHGLSRLR